jgi:hypothetical protein
LAAVAAFFLVFLPKAFVVVTMGSAWAPASPMADPVAGFARLAGAGAILVVLVTSIARHSASERVRWAACVAAVVVAILGVVAALAVPFQPLGAFLLVAHWGLAAGYLAGGIATPPHFFLASPPPPRWLDLFFALHLLSALLWTWWLVLHPDWMTSAGMGASWVPGPMADIARLFARFAAIGALLIATSLLLANHAESTRVRWAAWLAMTGISLSLVAAGLYRVLFGGPTNPSIWIAMLWLHVALSAAYLFVYILRRQEI